MKSVSPAFRQADVYECLKFSNLLPLYSTLAGYPFFSSDSATYAHDAGFGNVLFWNDHREPDQNGDRTDTIYFGGRKRTMLNDEQIYYEYPYLGQFEDYLWKTFEYRLTDLLGPEATIERRIVMVKYTLDLQERMTQLHGIYGHYFLDATDLKRSLLDAILLSF